MENAWVHTNILDMRRKPSFQSERLNQLLFGTVVSINDHEHEYYLVENAESYSGWVHQNGLEMIRGGEETARDQELRFMVTANRAIVYNNPNEKEIIAPYKLFYGTTVKGRHLKEVGVVVQLPNRQSVFLLDEVIQPIPKVGSTVSPTQIIREAKTLLGVPYLWGGITSLGFDCSGLVQTVFARFGISLPRDTKDQITTGEPVERSGVQMGDLLFFDRHVAIAMDADKIIHCSIGGNGVQIESLNVDDKYYRQDLDECFKTARRIL